MKNLSLLTRAAASLCALALIIAAGTPAAPSMGNDGQETHGLTCTIKA